MGSSYWTSWKQSCHSFLGIVKVIDETNRLMLDLQFLPLRRMSLPLKDSSLHWYPCHGLFHIQDASVAGCQAVFFPPYARSGRKSCLMASIFLSLAFHACRQGIQPCLGIQRMPSRLSARTQRGQITLYLRCGTFL